MRYVCMHKVSPEDEAELPPPPGLVEQMGALIGELAQKGAFQAGEGLRPSKLRYRLTREGAGWKVKTTEEALEWARRFGTAIEADELELGPLTEEWDLGMGAKPAGAPLRYMILPKATRARESGARQPAALRALQSEMESAGVLAFAATLEPSSKAVRARYRDNDRSLSDGPFAESKELIGGFCLVEMGSLDELLGFCDRFVRVLGGTRELDLRPLAAITSGGST
jgi:hypothetical protein